MNKKADKPIIRSGSPFLIILTLIVVLYILFLPPDARSDLLGDTSPGFVDDGENVFGPSGDRDAITEQSEFVFAGPGRIDVASRSSYEHKLASIRLITTSEATVFHSENPFILRYNVFGSKGYSMTFSVPDPRNVQDVFLVFRVDDAQGDLTLTLNGRPLYSAPVEQYQIQVRLPADQLLGTNVLDWELNAPGIAFWQTNRYDVSDVRVQGIATDTSNQQSRSTFTLRADEIQALQDIRVEFVPECEQNTVGRVSGSINNIEIFNQIPDCGIKNIHYFNENLVTVGTNSLGFEATQGTVLLDVIRIRTDTDEEANDVTFFFELDEDLFDFFVEVDEVCGEVDGVCPSNCGEDQDPDCCFREYENGYWCDVPTQNSGDRCVGSVNTNTIFRCPSGYENDDGDPDEDFEGICGDDTDGFCPIGCSRFYDKDCCLTDNSDRFWCDDVPVTGLADVCRDDLSADACRLCPDGYEGEDRNPSCEFDSRNQLEDETELSDDYEVFAEFIFVDDDENKEAEVIINGYTTNFDTFDDEERKDISRFVKDGSNYITIRPQSDFSLVEVRIDVDQT